MHAHIHQGEARPLAVRLDRHDMLIPFCSDFQFEPVTRIALVTCNGPLQIVVAMAIDVSATAVLAVALNRLSKLLEFLVVIS